MMLKVALVGVGGMGSVHLANWRKMKDVKLVAICDIRRDVAEAKAENETVYDNIDQLLEQEQLDIVDVCTPSYLHKEHSIKALSKGIHVLTEKPAALCSEDVCEMYRTAKEHHVKLMVAHVIRFMEPYRILKSLYQTEKYGKMLQGHFWRLSATPKWSWDNWMLSEEKSGLVPYDLHIHDCDFIYSMLGKPRHINVVRTKVQDNVYPDHYIATYDYDNISVRAEAAWFGCDQYSFRAGFQVSFEQAIVRFDGDGLNIYPTDGEVVKGTEAAQAENTGINLTSTDGYFEEMLYFKNCVLNNQEPTAVTCDEVMGVLSMIAQGIENENLIHAK